MPDLVVCTSIQLSKAENESYGRDTLIPYLEQMWTQIAQKLCPSRFYPKACISENLSHDSKTTTLCWLSLNLIKSQPRITVKGSFSHGLSYYMPSIYLIFPCL